MKRIWVEGKMVYCPMCGNKMKYLRDQRAYLCEFCGFQGTLDEIFRIREKRVRKTDVKEDYLRWWLSREKKG